ncbi:MAG: hypothetical protein P1S60_17020, partial [Anaerolineae bacterium]|nr:hypothetical protein [Anaerolineae bacterium]
TQYDLNSAQAVIQGDIAGEAASTNTPTPTNTSTPTPTALPEPTATSLPPTPTPEPITLTPTLEPIEPENGGLGGIYTSTFTITNTGELNPIDIAFLFLDQYNKAHANKNDAWLLGSLHPDSVTRYGVVQCQDYLSQVAGCCEDFTAVDAAYPVEFTYGRDNIFTIYPEAVRLLVEYTVAGETAPRSNDMHVVVEKGEMNWYAFWFTDCGDPLQ